MYHSVNTSMSKKIEDYICIICDCILRYIVPYRWIKGKWGCTL